LAALLAGTVTAAWMTGVYARTRRAYLTSVLDRAATAERERDQQTLLATAAERGRISREMHDIVAHTLSVMVALSDGAAMSVERDANAAGEAMQQSSALGRRALADLRRLLGGLDEPDGAVRAPTPGLNQVDALVGSVRAAGLPVELAMTGQPADVPPGLQLAVYRLVQESLTNVLKHAPTATRAVVTLSFGVSTVDLDVVNDGHARTVAAESGRSVGQGLTGMRERAAVFGGAVDAGPTPLGGWRVATRLTFGEDANLS
jgi:signal transduction histidine kinase